MNKKKNYIILKSVLHKKDFFYYLTSCNTRIYLKINKNTQYRGTFSLESDANLIFLTME